MRYLIILMGVVCLASPACGPPQQAEPVAAEEAPSAEADVEAVKAAIDEWQVAWNSRDLEKLLSLYADDAVRMPPNEVEEVGKNAIRESLQRTFDEMTSEGGGITVDVRVSGDLAYVRGTWEATHVPKTGESFKEKSKWVSILQRHPDGTWKTICETWNNNPLPTT